MIRYTRIICWLLSCTAPAVFALTNHWSSTSQRIYITGPGSQSLSDVKAAVPNAPLFQTSPGVWDLRANLIVEKGARLILHGTKIGGDCNLLRMKSNNTGASNDIVYISADWGMIDIRSTAITSLDDAVNGPDLDTDSRAFIRIRSTLDPDGVTPNESRMDILDSDVSYLGSHDAEAYGLVWKVLEAKLVSDRPYGALTNLYGLVNVYGNIMRSRLHHMYFGMYSFGAYGMQMTDNELDHNIGYGFDPHDDSDSLFIARNNVHHNGTHGIIASQRCNDLIIRDNISWNNGHNGIMLHRYCNDSLVENNRCLYNGDAGIAIFDNYRTLVRSNVCIGNFNAGVRFSVGPADNLVTDNEFSSAVNFGIYLYKGVDAPFPGDNGKPKRNIFQNNYVHHNAGAGIFLTTADDNTFRGNIFEANASTMWFINGLRNHVESNSIPNNVTVRLQGLPSALSSVFVKDQPALGVHVDAFSSVTFEDPAGKIFDPEEPGIATTVSPNGTSLTLTTAEIGKTSFVKTRRLVVTPDTGIALITASVWNTTGDLSKRWLTQAGSSTHSITYKIGDLAPGQQYRVIKNNVATRYTADATGTVIFQDTGVSTGVAEFVVTP